jgi:hypothetical protein
MTLTSVEGYSPWTTACSSRRGSSRNRKRMKPPSSKAAPDMLRMTTVFGHPRDLPASVFVKAESPFRDRGTDGSNPSPSSGESDANLSFLRLTERPQSHSERSSTFYLSWIPEPTAVLYRCHRRAPQLGLGDDPEPSLMMPGIIISCIFNEQGKLIFRAAPLQN